MPNSTPLAPHLPFLRRFARVLLGSQAAGDAYASATLEAIIADGSILSQDMDPRAALYRVFVRIWQSVAGNASASTDPASTDLATTDAINAADKNLEAIAPLPRVAFLLHSVEGFTVGRIAATLDCSPADVGDLIDRAGRELASQISTDVLIIEDEPIIAMDLEALVEELGHKVTHVCRTHHEAVAAVAEHRPGLVLADIHLADGSSGLDAVNEILSSTEVPVVFITAYPERLLTGQRPEPTFLITKPFRTETVKAIISQALFFDLRARRQRNTAVTA